MSETAVRDSAPAASIGLPAASAAFPFVRGDESGFPLAGALLLLTLVGVATWAWWKGRRLARATAGGLLSGAGLWRLPAAPVGATARVLGSTRLGPGATLHVVEWHGGEVLVAVSGASRPVVLARHPFDPAVSAGGPP